MAPVSDYLQYAQEVTRWASEAKTDSERKAFIDMAKAWMQCASTELAQSGDAVDDARINPSPPQN
jgi:hypothetical protein